MSYTPQHPSIKLTVGAQYICFDKQDTDGNWTDTFEDEVIKLPTITEVEIKDNSDTYESYASGAVYDADTNVASKEISETNIAFPTTLLEKMKGSTVDGGAILSGGFNSRPFFAYGTVVQKKDKSLVLSWFPKCKLTDNSDKTATSEDKHKDQTDTVTIKAYGFNENSNSEVKCDTSAEGFDTVTEDKFFAKPVLTIAEIKSLKTASTKTTS